MTTITDPALLKVYTDEDASCGDVRVADMIVQKARARGLAGATVLRGLTGYGQGSRIHAHHLFGISDNPPLVIEIVDAEERLRAFMTDLADLRDIGLVTLERVEVLSQPGHRSTREQDQL